MTSDCEKLQRITMYFDSRKSIFFFKMTLYCATGMKINGILSKDINNFSS